MLEHVVHGAFARFAPERVRILDAGYMSAFRPDAHRRWRKQARSTWVEDCLHYCFPGPPDDWNLVLLHMFAARHPGRADLQCHWEDSTDPTGISVCNEKEAMRKVMEAMRKVMDARSRIKAKQSVLNATRDVDALLASSIYHLNGALALLQGQE